MRTCAGFSILTPFPSLHSTPILDFMHISLSLNYSALSHFAISPPTMQTERAAASVLLATLAYFFSVGYARGRYARVSRS
jgi:hypothetical protein